MAPQEHSILVIDTVKMRQIRVLKVSGTPALASLHLEFDVTPVMSEIGPLRQFRARAHRLNQDGLMRRSQILIEPIECFFDQFVAWDVMSSFVNQMFLLVFRRT